MIYKILTLCSIIYIVNLVGYDDLAIALGRPTLSFWQMTTRLLIATAIMLWCGSRIWEKEE